MQASENPKYKILVVDDDPGVDQAFTLMLNFDGHEVQCVDGSLAALALLEHQKYDLIITEHLMPGMPGDQLAVLIKQRWPSQPVIMTSGSVVNPGEADSLIKGVDCLLNKPFTLAELRAAMNWVFQHVADHRQSESGSLGMNADQVADPAATFKPRKHI